MFFGRSVLLLLGGLAIGWAAGKEALQPMAPLFIDLFKGILALFLLEMGLIAAEHLSEIRRRGILLAAFARVVPVAFGFVGAATGWLLGLSPGGSILDDCAEQIVDDLPKSHAIRIREAVLVDDVCSQRQPSMSKTSPLL